MKMCFVRKAPSFKGEQIVFECIWGALFQHLVMALSLKAMIVVKNGFRGKLGFENMSSPQTVQNLCSNCAANCGNTFGPRPWTNETLAAAILWPYVAINPRSKKGTPQSPQPKADLTRPHSSEAGGKSMNGSRWSAQNETPHVTPCYTIGLTSYHFAGQYLQYQRRSNICTWSRSLDRTSMTISWSSKQFVCLWVTLSQSFLCGRYLHQPTKTDAAYSPCQYNQIAICASFKRTWHAFLSKDGWGFGSTREELHKYETSRLAKSVSPKRP